MYILGSFSKEALSKDQSTGYLEILDGNPTTYYSQGSKDYAIHLQQLLNNAISYFDNATFEEVNFDLMVLSKSDARLLGVQWPLPFSTNDRIYMPNQGFFRTELKHLALPESNFHVSDFISIHELGHLYLHERLRLSDDSVRFKNHKWFGEFIADYYMIGYMLEHLNSDEYPKWLSQSFMFLPFRYKSLVDFELEYSKLPTTNYVIYQTKFNELAHHIYPDKKWNLIPEMYYLYDSLTSKGLDRRASFPIINQYIANINSESSDWFKDMRPTRHPFLIGLSLMVFAALSIIFVLKKRVVKAWRWISSMAFTLLFLATLIFWSFYFF
jgi:hypothetical protein